MILLTGEAQTTAHFVSVIAVTTAVLGLVLLMFFAAPLIEHLLGKTGINVVTRLLGMLLAALSIQFVLDGLAGFGFGG